MKRRLVIFISPLYFVNLKLYKMDSGNRATERTLINSGNKGLAIFIPKRIRDKYNIDKTSSLIMVEQEGSIKFIINKK